MCGLVIKCRGHHFIMSSNRRPDLANLTNESITQIFAKQTTIEPRD